jgi:hypothetical protein
MRGAPNKPESASLVFDEPAVQRTDEGGRIMVFNAKRIELRGRMEEGAAPGTTVIEVVVRVAGAASGLHPLAAVPLDANIEARLRWFTSASQRPWPSRFRELQERGGKLEIAKVRVRQGEAIMVSAGGALGLAGNGNLDGQLEITVIGFEELFKALDREHIVPKDKFGGPEAIGSRTTLEGKPAVAVPLRLVDGLAMLGPIPLGRLPPLF